MELTLEHDRAGHRYRLLRDGQAVSTADYREIDDGSTLVFHHTVTPAEHRGNGYAGELIRRSFDDVRAAGRRVVAACWFVAEFLELHPEYRDLTTAPPRPSR